MRIKLMWKWYDIWVGFYIDWKAKAVYFCPIPTVVIKCHKPVEGKEGEENETS